MNTPLAERLRPATLDDLIGQKHLTGKGSILRTAIANCKVPSMILWGPPGVGKTTIANIIANTLKQPFYTLSAISSGVKDIREIIEDAKIGGMTPAMFSFKGRWEDCPPYTLLPTCRLA